MKPEEGNTVHPMAFPVITYENNRVFDDIKNSLYSMISDKIVISYWINKKYSQRKPLP